MSEEKTKKPKFDNSLDAWSFRFGMCLVAGLVIWLFFMMFLDASINFQCGVTEFFQGKCNRFDRKFVPWDKLEKQRGKSSLFRMDGYNGNRVVTLRFSIEAKV